MTVLIRTYSGASTPVPIAYPAAGCAACMVMKHMDDLSTAGKTFGVDQVFHVPDVICAEAFKPQATTPCGDIDTCGAWILATLWKLQWECSRCRQLSACQHPSRFWCDGDGGPRYAGRCRCVSGGGGQHRSAGGGRHSTSSEQTGALQRRRRGRWRGRQQPAACVGVLEGMAVLPACRSFLMSALQ